MKSMFSLTSPAPMSLVALTALVWAVIAVVLAALAPKAYVPHIFNSSHVEHLAAFYVVTLIGAAAFDKLSILRLATGIVLFAIVLAAIRMFQPAHAPWVLEDFLCDAAGVWAAIAPIFVARYRDRQLYADGAPGLWRR
jgi:hypothetical protein